MRVEDIPQELIDILDKHANKKHSRNGHVVRSLGEILTRYDILRVRELVHKVNHEPECEGPVYDDGSCDNFCWGCCKCEPCREGDFLVCGECLHVFRTSQELLDLHNEILRHLHYDVQDVTQPLTPPPLKLETDPTKVFSCPICAHDF